MHEDCGEQVYLPHKSANRHSNPKGVKSSEFLDDDTEGEAAEKQLCGDNEDGGKEQWDKKQPQRDEDSNIDSNNDEDGGEEQW